LLTAIPNFILTGETGYAPVPGNRYLPDKILGIPVNNKKPRTSIHRNAMPRGFNTTVDDVTLAAMK